VNPDAAPQELSVETVVGVEVAPVEVRLPIAELDDDFVEAHAGCANEEVVATLPVALRYQLASGSFKHSPMVTPV
jgi:hypothetical protein